MKLSLSGRILQGGAPEMSTVEFIHLARDTGFDMVELRPDQVPVDSSDADLAAMRQVLDDAAIGVSMLVVGGVGGGGFVGARGPRAGNGQSAGKRHGGGTARCR